MLFLFGDISIKIEGLPCQDEHSLKESCICVSVTAIVVGMVVVRSLGLLCAEVEQMRNHLI